MKFTPTIIADDRIPYVREAFKPFGKLITLPGREMNAITIRDADILLVRSITRVDELLIGKSSIRYVATASTGFDHVDTKFLHDRGIHFFTASGCNANSVSEYIIIAIAELCKRYCIRFTDVTIGIIGVGKIGSRVAEKSNILGINVMLNDPPLKEKTGGKEYLPLDTVLRQSDIVSVHVPLTDKGDYPTANLVNHDFLGKMKPGSILINTSRGAVVDEQVLYSRLHDKHLRSAVLDVWRNEPAINVDLLKLTDIGTPHIAGHSIDGQVNATVMVHGDLCKFLNNNCEWKPGDVPLPDHPAISVDAFDSVQDKITEAVLHVYPVMYDDQNLRRIIKMKKNQRPQMFDKFRNERYVRREFDSYRITSSDKTALSTFTKLGFQT